MVEIPFYFIMFQSLPETAILISLGLVLIGIKPRLKTIFIVALVTSFISYFIRSLPLPTGIHVLLQMPILIYITAYLCRLKIGCAALASFIGLIALFLTETVFNIIILKLTGIPLKQALTDPLLRLAFPLPEFIFLTILAWLCIRKEFTLFNIKELADLENVKSYEE